MSGDAGALHELQGEYTDCTQSHHHPGALLWVVSCLNCSVFLERPQHSAPRESSSSLSKQPVGCIPWCSTDSLAAFVLFAMLPVFTVRSGSKMAELMWVLGSREQRLGVIMSAVKQWASSHRLTNDSPGPWPTNFTLLALVVSCLQSLSNPVLPTMRHLHELAGWSVCLLPWQPGSVLFVCLMPAEIGVRRSDVPTAVLVSSSITSVADFCL